MAKRVLTLRKEKGVISNVSEINTMLPMWFRDIPNGTYVLTLEKPSKPRSNEQNHLMWLWFGVIAEAWSDSTGRVFTKQNVHDAYCELFLPIDTPKGRIAGKTSGLTTEEFTKFLNRVQVDAQTEYGIYLPDPEDYNFAAWVKMHGGNQYFED